MPISSRTLGLVRKLRGRSARELHFRVVQRANVWLERAGLSADTGAIDDAWLWTRLSAAARSKFSVGDADGLLANYRASPNRFLAGFDDRDATVSAIRSRWPNAAAEIVARADAIIDGRFDLLGYQNLSFGDPIDWHADPLARRRAPAIHWSKIDFLDPSVVGDHKLIWELNRQQYFIALGRAYWLTGDERYAETIVRHLESWMDWNPPKIGVNWASSLELSYRAISWLWALSFLRQSRALRARTFTRVLAYLDIKARHIARHLSTYFSPNTHLTGEALGLLAIGSALPELEQAERWITLGRSILEQQLPRQVRGDGSYVEQSPHYHRYTIEIYLLALAIARRGSQAFSGDEARLTAALDHAMFITMPDGTFPLVGDDDGGQLIPLDHRLNDFRPALSTAAALFGRPDYACVAGKASEPTLWLLGPSGLTSFDALPQHPPRSTSRAFCDGGYYVMRDRWTSDSDYMLVDAGPHGFLTAGHAHADALSFVLSVGGTPVFVDPGTCVYTSMGGERDRFRSTASHNTATVGDSSSSEPGHGPFQWTHVAQTTVDSWTSGELHDFLRGAHDGFSRLRPPARHERSILYVKGRYWVIRDRILGAGAGPIRLRFHCAPGARVEIPSRDRVHVAVPEIGGVDLLAFGGGAFAAQDDLVCPVYGWRVPASTCVFTVDHAAPAEVVTFVMPAGARLSSVSSEAPGVYQVHSDDARDTHHITGDRVWVWRSESAAGVREIVVDGDSSAVRSAATVPPFGRRDASSGLAATGAAE
jgi:uncharacterized heparinase superfamily protein